MQRTLRHANSLNANSLKASKLAENLVSADQHGIYATYNLHANQPGMYAGYELHPELSGYLYREEIFRRQGEAVGTYENASGIIGILYFHFASRTEAETYLYDMPWYLRVRVINLKTVSPGTDIRSIQALVSSVSSSSHPTIQRLCQSMMAVRYRNPCFIGM